MFLRLCCSAERSPAKAANKSGTDGAKTDAKISDFTLLVYICGSDLEQKRGAATANIAEMLSADIPRRVNVILQTGGSSKWRNFDIPSDRSNRYAVKNGTLELIESNPPVNMGSERAFASFLKFGIEKISCGTDRRDFLESRRRFLLSASARTR